MRVNSMRYSTMVHPEISKEYFENLCQYIRSRNGAPSRNSQNMHESCVLLTLDIISDEKGGHGPLPPSPSKSATVALIKYQMTSHLFI
jgi:hypothetical protein